MPEIEFKAGEPLKWELQTHGNEPDEPYSLKQAESSGKVLEMEDVNFHLNSAVLLPDNADNLVSADEQEAEDRITPIGIMRVLLDYAKDNPDHKILVAGHTDTSGQDEYNLHLSDLRAKNVQNVLTGEKSGWVDICLQKSKIEDYQRICKWAAATQGWDSDPGKVDNVTGPKTRGAVKGLQQGYNQDFEADIDESGSVGKETWAAIFDVYQAQIAAELEVNREVLKGRQESLAFLEPGGVGCGEKWPIDAPRKNDYRSEKNRRVEVMFFEPDTAPTPDGSQGDCGFCQLLYTPGNYSFEHIPVEPKPPATILKAYLQLKYKDDQGQPQPFPKGFRFQLKYTNGLPTQVELGEEGKVEVGVRRRGETFTLDFTREEPQFLVKAEQDGEPPTCAEEHTALSLAKDRSYFAFPLEWDLSTAEWTVEGAETYDEGQHSFSALEDQATIIGKADTPVTLTVDVRWQHFQFVYFDRKAKKQDAVPLELELQGWNDAAAADPAKPQTRARWAGETAQALPWFLSEPQTPADGEPLLAFATDATTFVKTADDGSRTVEYGRTLDEANPERLAHYDLPTAFKSKGWWARHSAGTPDDPPSTQNVWKDMAATETTDANPLMFFLDDMVLTDTDLAPLDWKADGTIPNRLALFCNTFRDDGGSPDDSKLSTTGLFDADVANKQEFFTKDPTDITDRNYIATYPRWTRIVVCLGNLFDAFDKRLPEGDDRPVGARAAVRHVDAPALFQAGKPVGDTSPARVDSAFFHVQPYFQQHFDWSRSYARPQGLVTPRDIVKEWESPHGQPLGGWGARTCGRYDMALVRCCELDDDGNEVALSLQYYRLFFNFAPGATSAVGGGAMAPTTLAASEHPAFVNDACKNLCERWNGETPKHGDPCRIEPESEAIKLRIKSKWFAQGLDVAHAHYDLGIFDPGGARAFMSSNGTGALELSDNPGPWAGAATLPPGVTVSKKVPGSYTMAHEAGHAGSMMDEYNEQWTSHSHNMKSFTQNIPADPFSLDDNAMMMIGTRFIRTRYFWHIADWCYKALSETELVVKQTFLASAKRGSDPAEYVYKLPHHPYAPVRNYCGWPMYSRVKTLWQPRARFHVFVYPLGKDQMAYGLVPSATKGDQPFDGILVVMVKMRWKFTRATMPIAFGKMTTDLAHAHLSIDTNFNKKYYATGFELGGRTFDRCLIHFSPRYLVETYAHDNDSYLTDHLGFTVPAAEPARTAYLTGPMAADEDTAGSWLAKIKSFDETYHPRDFYVQADDSIVAGSSGWATNSGPMADRRVLNLSLKDNLKTDFYKWFADMVGLDMSDPAPTSWWRSLLPGRTGPTMLDKLQEVILSKVTDEGEVKAL